MSLLLAFLLPSLVRSFVRRVSLMRLVRVHRTGVKFSWKKADLFDLDSVDAGIYADQAGMDLETL